MRRNSISSCIGQRAAVAMGLLLATGLALLPAFATADELQSRKVKVADLDLASPAGRQALDRRLRAAIDQVCSPRGSVRASPGLSRDARVCKQQALADVQQQLEASGASQVLTAGR